MFREEEEIRVGPAMTSCTYLHACIDESMRMSPTIPGALSREVQKGGAIVDGLRLPEDTIVSVAAYTVQHNEDNHPDSFSYHPERWIVGESFPGQITTKESLQRTRSAHVPFSTGPRGCIGKHLALNQVALFLARLLFAFDVRISLEGPSGGGQAENAEPRRQADDEYQLQDYFISQAEGPTVNFRSLCN